MTIKYSILSLKKFLPNDIILCIIHITYGKVVSFIDNKTYIHHMIHIKPNSIEHTYHSDKEKGKLIFYKWPYIFSENGLLLFNHFNNKVININFNMLRYIRSLWKASKYGSYIDRNYKYDYNLYKYFNFSMSYNYTNKCAEIIFLPKANKPKEFNGIKYIKCFKKRNELYCHNLKYSKGIYTFNLYKTNKIKKIKLYICIEANKTMSGIKDIIITEYFLI